MKREVRRDNRAGIFCVREGKAALRGAQRVLAAFGENVGSSTGMGHTEELLSRKNSPDHGALTFIFYSSVFHVVFYNNGKNDTSIQNIVKMF